VSEGSPDTTIRNLEMHRATPTLPSLCITEGDLFVPHGCSASFRYNPPPDFTRKEN
jgi:hypothetical protein